MLGRTLVLTVLLATAVFSKTWDVAVGPAGANTFEPAALTIQLGDSVRFTWQSSSPHTVTEQKDPADCQRDDDASGDGLERQDSSTNGFQYLFTPTDNNDLFYFCEYHCDVGMEGSISFEVCEPLTPDVCQVTDLTVVEAGEVCDRRACQTANGPVQRVCNANKGYECLPNRTINNLYNCQMVVEAKIGESCAADNVVCRDGLYDVDCEGNDVCGNDNYLEPGEACTTASKAICDNDDCCAHGSCTAYPTTKCASGFCCEFAATGEDCGQGLECSAADYCTWDGGNVLGTCMARKAAGATGCEAFDESCVPGTACVVDTCTELFTVALGGQCSTTAVCLPGLYCGVDGTCKESLLKQGDACTTDAQCGPEPADCDCDENGGQVCYIPIYTNKEADAIKAALECAARNNCFVDTSRGFGSFSEYFPGSCLEQACNGEIVRVLKLADASSPAAAAAAAMVALVAAAVALVL